MSKLTIYYFSTKTLGTVHTAAWNNRSLCGLSPLQYSGTVRSFRARDFKGLPCMNCQRVGQARA